MDTERLGELDHDWQEVQRYLRTRTRRGIREQLGSPVDVAGFQILGHLLRRGPLAPSDLAACLDVRSSTMTTQLDRLEEAGWVRRVTAADGNTRVKVSATSKGAAAYEAYRALRRALLESLLNHLTDEEQDLLARFYRRLAAGVQAERAGTRRAGE